VQKSKATVKQLLDPYFLHRLCDAPKKEREVRCLCGMISLKKKISGKKMMLMSAYQKKGNNRILNAKRNKQVRAGQKVLAKEEQSSEDDREQKTLTTPKKPTSAGKLPSTWNRPSITRKTPSKHQQTAGEPTSAPSKRRLRTDNDEDYQTPTKKRGKSVAAKSELLPSPVPQVAQAVTDSPRVVVPAQSPDLVHRHHYVVNNGPPRASDKEIQHHCQMLSLADLEQLALYDDPPSGVERELSLRYRQMICRLLGVGLGYATHCGLLEMRVYARAYNASLRNTVWFHRGMPGKYQAGLRHLMYELDGTTTAHFAHAMPVYPFPHIAHERHDILGNGAENPHGPGFFPPPTSEERRALGMDDNPFGMPVGLSNNPIDPRIRYSPQ
jgi:hypothetical protein